MDVVLVGPTTWLLLKCAGKFIYITSNPTAACGSNDRDCHLAHNSSSSQIIMLALVRACWKRSPPPRTPPPSSLLSSSSNSYPSLNSFSLIPSIMSQVLKWVLLTKIQPYFFHSRPPRSTPFPLYPTDIQKLYFTDAAVDSRSALDMSKPSL